MENHNRKSENVSKSVTPEGLAVLAMKEGNTKVPVFYQFVDKLEKVDKETSIHQEMLEDYELIQYDMLEGNSIARFYLKNSFSAKFLQNCRIW